MTPRRFKAQRKVWQIVGEPPKVRTGVKTEEAKAPVYGPGGHARLEISEIAARRLLRCLSQRPLPKIRSLI